MSAPGVFPDEPASGRPQRPWRLAINYALMLAGTVVLFLFIRSWGEGLSASDEWVAIARPASQPLSTGHVLGHLLLALAAVMVLGQLLGAALSRLGQPPVIGEVVAGILLGPSLLGRISLGPAVPHPMEFLIPAAILPLLGVIAQLGVILYMFLVGLELDAGRLKSRIHTTVAISHASIVLPFLLGALLAVGMHRELAPEGVPFTSFALFMGAALSVTAFPVLARILRDRRLSQTELGLLALACAAADDVTAWCLLAFVVGVAQADWADTARVCGLTLSYIVLMFVVARPLAERCARRIEGARTRRGVVAALLTALLLSAATTEAIGIHAVFGAFLLGAVIPRNTLVDDGWVRALEDLVTVLLLPAFFAYTGMRTEIGLLSSWHDWAMCGLIVLAATAGKFGGTLLAGRLTGLDWRTSSALGILMNTRGLMELIVLNIGLDLGVISPRLFAMMVLMAVITTLATTPLLQLMDRRRRFS